MFDNKRPKLFAMAPVTIYTRRFCGYCSAAKSLLEDMGVSYDEIDATGSPEKRNEMIQRSGRFTYPQIFIGSRHVGGCDDLYELKARGELDALLTA
jgi:glutaredoxin 3